jgi:hypothetical protein
MRFAILMVLALTACSGPGARAARTGTAPDCADGRILAELPAELSEASGITQSGRTAGIFWLHNDDNPPVIYAIDTTGTIKARVQVAGLRNRDWEDIAAAPCGNDHCLYIADVGDNMQNRQLRSIARISEPALTDTVSSEPVRYQFRTPGKSHDAEAIVVLPDDELYLITKGRSGPVTVFAFPKPLVTDAPMELEEVGTLSEGLVQMPDMVTGAAVLPGTRVVAVRTYGGLQFYRARKRSFDPVYEQPYDLRSLNEPQGEGIAVLANGTVMLASEKSMGKTGLLSRLQCTLPQ